MARVLRFDPDAYGAEPLGSIMCMEHSHVSWEGKSYMAMATDTFKEDGVFYVRGIYEDGTVSFERLGLVT